MSTLTEQMRTQTSEIHDQSDRLVNLKLAFVLTSRQLYGESIGLFAPIYEKLENALHRHQSHTQLKTLSTLVLSKEMNRSPSFEDDVIFYIGEEGMKILKRRQKEGQPMELKLYLDHLDELEKEDPVYLVAYIYHMYMAIFAGGFLIRKMVKRAFGLKDENGIRALSFPSSSSGGVDTARDLRRKLKLCVNHEMNLTEEQRKRILRESDNVFVMNSRLVGTVQRTQCFADVVSLWMRRLFWLFVVIVFVSVVYHYVK